MSNAAHCMFENTYKDLVDCLDAMSEHPDLNDFIKEKNQYDAPYVKRLIKLCKEIAVDFGDEL